MFGILNSIILYSAYDAHTDKTSLRDPNEIGEEKQHWDSGPERTAPPCEEMEDKIDPKFKQKHEEHFLTLHKLSFLFKK